MVKQMVHQKIFPFCCCGSGSSVVFLLSLCYSTYVSPPEMYATCDILGKYLFCGIYQMETETTFLCLFGVCSCTVKNVFHFVIGSTAAAALSGRYCRQGTLNETLGSAKPILMTAFCSRIPAERSFLSF